MRKNRITALFTTLRHPRTHSEYFQPIFAEYYKRYSQIGTELGDKYLIDWNYKAVVVLSKNKKYFSHIFGLSFQHRTIRIKYVTQHIQFISFCFPFFLHLYTSFVFFPFISFSLSLFLPPLLYFFLFILLLLSFPLSFCFSLFLFSSFSLSIFLSL